MGYEKIFVALDGSEEQLKVLERAIALAANDEAELYIGHAIDTTALESAGAFPASVVKDLENEFHEKIAPAVEAARPTRRSRRSRS